MSIYNLTYRGFGYRIHFMNVNINSMGPILIIYVIATCLVWIVLSTWHSENGWTWAHEHRSSITLLWPIFLVIWFLRKVFIAIKTLIFYAYNGSM